MTKEKKKKKKEQRYYTERLMNTPLCTIEMKNCSLIFSGPPHAAPIFITMLVNPPG